MWYNAIKWVQSIVFHSGAQIDPPCPLPPLNLLKQYKRLILRTLEIRNVSVVKLCRLEVSLNRMSKCYPRYSVSNFFFYKNLVHKNIQANNQGFVITYIN